MVASSFIHSIISRSCLFPTSKSLGSFPGVILTAPEPFSGSGYSSAIRGIFRPTTGSTYSLPILSLYLSSSGLTAIATSPNIVSGLLVAIIMESSPSAASYLKYQYLPFFSSCSTSASDREVLHTGQ